MQILTFLLRGEQFAIDIKLVDTIQNKMPITPVPKSKKYVIGLISNRGSVIPIINTSLILNAEDTTNTFEKFIIINLGNEKLALAVNDIDDVLEIEQKTIENIDNDEDFSIVKVNSNIITLLTYKQLQKI
ncbi:MAG TPA: chemotaxis protein CheW [Candidatus Paceibacterota bacterium]